jgi:hypothetical protein
MKTATLTDCPKCKQPKMQHKTCANCGTYDGRQVLRLDNPLEKKSGAKSSKTTKKKK